MTQLDFFERIGNLFQIVFTSSSFLLLFVLFLLTIVMLVINLKVKKRLIKVLCSIFYIGVAVFVFIFYGNSIFHVSDTVVDKLFTVLYFPNYISYLCMIVISLILLCMTWINKKRSNFVKVGNTLSFLTIFFLFLLTLDIVTKNGIDITERVEVYQNSTLVVLIQTSMGVFGIWIGILLVDQITRFIVRRMNGNVVEVEVPKEKLKVEVNPIMSDVVVLSDEGFETGFHRYQSKMRYQEYMDIVSDESE